MKKYIFLFCLLQSVSSGFSQFTKDSAELTTRLDLFMQHNRDMNFEKILDYTYPKLYTIATKEQVREALESVFNSDEFNIKMDSLKIEKIYPLFASGNNRYAKINYSMYILMSPKLQEDSTSIAMLVSIMQKQIGNENVRFDKNTNTLIIFQKVDMAAIKDELSPEWTFFNLNKDDPMMEQLLDKEIISKFYSN